MVCDERINNEETLRAGKINLAFGFAASKPGEYHAFLVTHDPSGSRTRNISVNRFANYSPSVDLEIESSILRGLVPLDRGDEGDTVRMPRPRPTAPAPAACADAGGRGFGHLGCRPRGRAGTRLTALRPLLPWGAARPCRAPPATAA